MTEEQVAKLRAAGFSDEDINDYQANAGKSGAPTGPVSPDAPLAAGLPEVDVSQPSETLRNAQAAGVATTNTGSMMTDAAAVGAAVAPYVVPAAATGAGLYAAGKVGGWGRNLANQVGQGIHSFNTSTLGAQHAAEGIADRELMRQGGMTAQEAAQRQYAREAAMQAQRAAGQSTAQATQQTARQSMAQKVRQMAAQRIIPAMAGAAVPAAVGAAVAAPGAAMMYDAYKNYQGQSPEERKRSAMEALSGQGLGQAGIY
jgi:hypothetical protein